MLPFARFANRTWISGIVVAFLGVVLARMVAPYLEPGTKEWVDVAGQVTAFAGLFIIAYGIKQRRDSAAKDDTDGTENKSGRHD